MVKAIPKLLPCTFGGEYNTVNVISGVSYTFSTCNAGYDTQITLINDASANVEGYNDDFCELQSQITWTATYTGVLRVLVDAFSVQTTQLVLKYL